jgi:hypothetical protein
MEAGSLNLAQHPTINHDVMRRSDARRKNNIKVAAAIVEFLFLILLMSTFNWLM